MTVPDNKIDHAASETVALRAEIKTLRAAIKRHQEDVLDECLVASDADKALWKAAGLTHAGKWTQTESDEINAKTARLA